MQTLLHVSFYEESYCKDLHGFSYEPVYKQSNTRRPKIKKKLLELQGKSKETLEIFCTAFHSFESEVSSADLKGSTIGRSMCLKAIKPYRHYKKGVFYILFSLSLQFLSVN